MKSNLAEQINTYTKVCTKCGEEKLVSEFSKNAGNKDGLNGRCKVCIREYRIQNRDHLVTKNKEWRHNNKQRVKESQQKYRDDNRNKLRAYQQEFREKNRENLRLQAIEYRKKNHDKIQAQRQRYRQKHGDRLRRQEKERNDAYSGRIHDYYGGHCYIPGCDAAQHYEIYHCHHIDPLGLTDEALTKEFSPGAERHRNWDREVEPELCKCVYLCANHHAMMHAGRFDEDIASGKLKLIPGKRNKLDGDN